MIDLEDQLGRRIVLGTAPQRIVSLVPSQTELLVNLGLRDRIVGITKFCVHPRNLRMEKMVVGGTKTVHLGRIKGLNPDIILCNKEENTSEMVYELERMAPVHVSDIRTMNDALALIGVYGQIFQVRNEAQGLVEGIVSARERLQKDLLGKPIKRAAYLIWKGPWMAAGKDTFIDHLMAVNHLENIFLPEEGRYPEVSLEELKRKRVELVLLSTEPYPFKQKDREFLQSEFAGIGVHIVDGEYFSWYGSRLTAAFEYFRGLHPTFLS